MKTRPFALFNIVLATALLTSLLLVGAVPSSGVGEYDPWCDYDEDGDIDIYDAVTMAGSYGTTGDATKNVSVTNFPMHEPEPAWKAISVVENFNLSWTPELIYEEVVSDATVLTELIGGYSRMMLYMRIADFSDVGGNTTNENYAVIDIALAFVYEYVEISWITLHFETDSNFPTTGWNSTFPSTAAGMYAVRAPYLRITISGRSYTPFDENLPSRISSLISIGIYLRNE